MGFLDNFKGHHDEVANASHEHKGHMSHELIAGAASFAAVKAWEDKNKRDGKPANHALAKQLLAGFAGAEIDKLIETKGLNYVDREKAKREAQHNVEKYYEHEHERR